MNYENKPRTNHGTADVLSTKLSFTTLEKRFFAYVADIQLGFRYVSPEKFVLFSLYPWLGKESNMKRRPPRSLKTEFSSDLTTYIF